jgi:hypothetical protein
MKSKNKNTYFSDHSRAQDKEIIEALDKIILKAKSENRALNKVLKTINKRMR